jgi:hypothetical protein
MHADEQGFDRHFTIRRQDERTGCEATQTR